jgi:hypothetical protein
MQHPQPAQIVLKVIIHHPKEKLYVQCAWLDYTLVWWVHQHVIAVCMVHLAVMLQQFV